MVSEIKRLLIKRKIPKNAVFNCQFCVFVDFYKKKVLIDKKHSENLIKTHKAFLQLIFVFFKFSQKKTLPNFHALPLARKKRPLIQIYGLWKRREKARSLIWLAMWTNVNPFFRDHTRCKRSGKAREKLRDCH